MYKISKIDNKLRIATCEMKDRNSIAIGFWIGVGGRYEEDSQKGAAHFLEHIVFKGSRKYSCEEIKIKIEGVGGTLNAFTSEEQTCFYAKIPAKHFVQTFDVLADMVFYPKISVSDVVKEKTVIIEEIKMYRDLPQYQVVEFLDGLVWPEHPLGKSLAGTIETVDALQAKDLKNFHQQYYTPSNVIVSVGGKISHSKVAGLVKNRLGSFKAESNIDFAPFKAKQNSPQVKFYKKDTEQMHLALGMHGYDENHADRYALNLLNIILGGNMSSRLFEEVREKHGLAYSIGSSCKTLHDTGLFMVRAGVDNHKIVDALGLVLKELYKVKKSAVSNDEFRRSKDYLLGQIELGLEDTMEHMLWVGESMIVRNQIKKLSDVVKILEKISISDVKRVANDVLKEQRFNLALIGPIKEEQEKGIKKLMGIN